VILTGDHQIERLRGKMMESEEVGGGFGKERKPGD